MVGCDCDETAGHGRRPGAGRRTARQHTDAHIVPAATLRLHRAVARRELVRVHRVLRVGEALPQPRHRIPAHLRVDHVVEGDDAAGGAQRAEVSVGEVEGMAAVDQAEVEHRLWPLGRVLAVPAGRARAGAGVRGLGALAQGATGPGLGRATGLALGRIYGVRVSIPPQRPPRLLAPVPAVAHLRHAEALVQRLDARRHVVSDVEGRVPRPWADLLQVRRGDDVGPPAPRADADRAEGARAAAEVLVQRA
eukprot:scaffold126340_cov78-Phaeocystis_antarctica.AAC.2